MIDLVAADAGQVIAFGIKEEAFEQAAGIGHRGWVAWAQFAINVFEGFLFVLGRIFFERLDQGVVLIFDIDDGHCFVTEVEQLADDADGEWFVGAGDDDFAIEHVANGEFGGECFFLWVFREFEFVDAVEFAQDVFVRGVADGTEERGGEEFPAAAAAIEVDVEQVVSIELYFQPGAAVWDDAEAVESFAIEVEGFLEADAWGAVELGDHDSFGAIDDEGTAFGHERKFAHVHAFFFFPGFVGEGEGDVQRSRERLAIALGLVGGQFGFTNFVMREIENALFVVA